MGCIQCGDRKLGDHHLFLPEDFDLDLFLPEDFDLDLFLPEDLDLFLPEDLDHDLFLPEDFDLDLFLPEDLDRFLPEDLDLFLPEDFDLDLFLCGDLDLFLCGDLRVSEVFLSTEEVDLLPWKLGKGDVEFNGAGPPWLVGWRLRLDLWEEEDEAAAVAVVAAGGCWDSSGARLKRKKSRHTVKSNSVALCDCYLVCLLTVLMYCPSLTILGFFHIS